ncbi:MAG TPA: cation diffusion facilitator family transporter [Saprospiraceae bacterium]|nr:cation diffusion facilitator family transporter [Saprospiraceae bacterium]
MGHDHQHHQKGTQNLKTAFFLNLGFTIFEIIGGVYVNSVAIISDAIHDLGDSLSLGTAWYLNIRAQKEADQKYSFGYARFSLLGALINSLVLIGGSIFIISEAVGRLMEPEHADASGMLIFAIVGIAVNGYAAWKMSSGKSLNERVVSWHLLEDVLGWVAVAVVAIVLHFTDNHYLDPVLSLLITLYILWGVIKRLKETLFVFLQGVPKDIDLESIKRAIRQVDKVQSLHHTHVWSLEGEHHVFTTHVKLEGITDFEEIMEAKRAIKAIISNYAFQHYTIETELDDETCELV